MTEQQQNRPKIEFADNVDVTLEWKFDSKPFREGDGQYGPWYLHTVVDQSGEDASLFLGPEAQELIELADPGRGSVVTIRRMRMSKKDPTTWHVWHNGEAVSRTGEAPAATVVAPAATPTVVTHPKPVDAVKGTQGHGGQHGPSYADLVNLMGACVKDAHLVWGEAQGSTEYTDARAIQAIASTLFIEARKMKLNGPDYSEPDTSGVIAQEGIERVVEVFDGDPGHGEPPPEDADLPF